MRTGHALARLVESPALVQTVRSLPGPAFAALVRRIGVEDAGELVALATTEQLVAAFDEDLFGNPRPGEQETFDPARFVIWLEVLLEAGDAIAAQRTSELDLDFVVHALGSLIVVLEHEAIDTRMAEGDRDARLADKAIDNALSESIDGYLLISRRHDGWDAVLSLVLALDRDHRTFLERVLDRCAAINSDYLDDLAALVGVLSERESNAEDALGAREDRRTAQGYVEPRAAKAFLAAARAPIVAPARDPLTRAYLRELDHTPHVAETELPDELRALLDDAPERALPAAPSPILAALRELPAEAYAARMRELAYLANVLVAGATYDGRRFAPYEATQAVLATIALAAALRGASEPDALRALLASTEADHLFREAASHLAKIDPRSPGFVV